ncbi:DNA topoisomerase IB [Microbacterium sp. M28]|uniref:DNA topoisomerase IB n=1 Tax=Microbacterium sp. M28 TaxID=2962064 RepID=UPI0021F4D825|nr:DNA topoisomerase IB [Microbacterium sp. M28]UYO97104.1 DNA topoisomerase IB [Microbacterium sp. M28]
MPRIRRVDPASLPGIRRVRSRGRFRYRNPDGSAVSADDRERIAALVIPPAWTNVWISPDPDGHVQATGTDAAGRRQYIYHPRWRTRQDGEKFERALRLAAALPALRAQATRALRGDDERARVLAVAFRLLDRTAIRIGSPGYLRRYGSRGLTTLRWADVSWDSATITLTFRGKMSLLHAIEFEDEDLLAWIASHAAHPPRAFLLRYSDGRRRRAIGPADVNAFLAEAAGEPFTAKDFRTLRGTTTAALVLAERADEDAEARERVAIDAVATALGNTSAVAKASYIDPRVLAAARKGRFVDPTQSPENALLRLLGRA